jgi:hypothetical protein
MLLVRSIPFGPRQMAWFAIAMLMCSAFGVRLNPEALPPLWREALRQRFPPTSKWVESLT